MSRAEVAVLTGGTGAIGSAIARGLVANGYHLVLVVRDRARGEHFVSSVNGPGKTIDLEVCDLGRQHDIRELATRFPHTIDVLVNNAAECPRRRLETPEGYSLTADAALRIAARALAGDAPPGFQTPSRAYGADFVLCLEGVVRTDVS